MKGECLALKQFQLSDSKQQQRLATGKTNRYSFVFFYTLIVANEINKANLLMEICCCCRFYLKLKQNCT